MGGFRVMNILKQEPDTQDTSMIVVSAWPTADNYKRVLEAGAQGFIAKPFQTEALFKATRENLSQAE